MFKDKIESIIICIEIYCRSFRDFFSNMVIGLQNIIEYAPIIYDDRDWDRAYLDILIIYKLKRMERNFKMAKVVDNTRQVRNLAIARTHLERMNNDDISPTHSKALEEWWNQRTEYRLDDDLTVTEWKETPETTRLDKILNREHKKSLRDFAYHKQEFMRLWSKYYDTWWW